MGDVNSLKRLADVVMAPLDQMDSLLNGLTPREREIIELRWGLLGGERRTLVDVGNRLRMTSGRVRMIEARSFKKLRHAAQNEAR